MRKIIEVKNDKIGLDWMEYEPRPQRDKESVINKLRRLVADEKINRQGFIYRIRSING